MRKASRQVWWVGLILIWAVPLTARTPAPQRLTVLLSNDDGYSAPGLQALIRALEPVADVYVAAPADNQSGKGHSITIGQPLYVHDEKQPDGRTYYAIEATPATCVRLGLEALMPKKPDLVISGINRGENLGLIVYYSGTLGAAREAAMAGLPAIAVSMGGDRAEDYAAAAAYTRSLVDQLRALRLIKRGLFLNVNFPVGERHGVRVARLSMTTGRDLYERRADPDGHSYFLQTWQPARDDTEGTDVWAFVRGYITLTPLMVDETQPQALSKLEALERGLAVATPAK